MRIIKNEKTSHRFVDNVKMSNISEDKILNLVLLGKEKGGEMYGM